MMQMERIFIVSPTKRDWNHRPSRPPMSISESRFSRSVTTAVMSMLVLPMITPAL
jgi:hypothetical protein